MVQERLECYLLFSTGKRAPIQDQGKKPLHLGWLFFVGVLKLELGAFRVD
jgi:hypothetical protein